MRTYIAITLIVVFLATTCVYAGQLTFDGVPVDITTSTGEDLVFTPGEGGVSQVGDKVGGTRDLSTTNDDLFITGNLEVEGQIRLEGALSAYGAASFSKSVTLGGASSDDLTVNARVKNEAGIWVNRQITKKLHPHYLRHCRAKHLVDYYNFSDTKLRVFFEWSDTKMAATYANAVELEASF